MDAFITSLIDSNLPVLHIQENNLFIIDDDTIEKAEIIKKIHKSPIQYITKRTEELLDTEFSKELPFDIMMFRLGDYRNI